MTTDRVLIFGSGQLASELKRISPDGSKILFLDRTKCDLSDLEKLRSVIRDSQPSVVINAAAYTAVDKAEVESELAMAVNSLAPEGMAEVCKEINAFLLHISTDFVFDGKASQPYRTDAQPNPVSVYGASKLNGEQRVSSIMESKFAIIRTSWVYSQFGNNFVHTMLRLMKEKESLSVVGDQIGTPTWAYGLAQICWRVLDMQIQGIHHWTDAGIASWYDFAVAIQRIGLDLGLLSKEIPIHSIPSSGYPTPAKRPAFSVLDKAETLKALDIELHEHWQDQLRRMLQELRN